MPTEPSLESPLIRTHEVVGREGVRARALRLFCPLRVRSVDLKTCERCPHLASLPESADDPGACITCTPPRSDGRVLRQDVGVPDSFAAVARTTKVGAAMGSRVICVRPEVPVASLGGEFHGARSLFLPVVQGSGRLLGVLWRSDLAPPSIRENMTLRDRLGGASVTTVAEQMDLRPIVVHEGSPLSDALWAMTDYRARTVTVVGADGTVAGLLSDLEVLMWFARQRRRLGL